MEGTPITERHLLSRLRLRIGNQSVLDLDERRLMLYVKSALDWMAGKLHFHVKQENNAIGLSAGVIEYPIPNDMLSMIWCEWNDRRLEPMSLTELDRDRSSWNNRDSGEPAEWAIQGRKLAILPPPSAAAITTDAYVTIRYIATPQEPGADGPQGLSELDGDLLVAEAARRWCEDNPSEENTARLQSLNARIENDLLPDAKARWMNPTELHFPSIKVESTRRGTAR